MSESEPAEELAALKESKLTETEKPPARISAMAFVPHKRHSTNPSGASATTPDRDVQESADPHRRRRFQKIPPEL